MPWSDKRVRSHTNSQTPDLQTCVLIRLLLFIAFPLFMLAAYQKKDGVRYSGDAQRCQRNAAKQQGCRGCKNSLCSG